jgi:DNA-nicking Smr family endonuclease
MDGGIVELDLHGCNTYQAKIAVDAALRRARGGTYRIRVIHGSHGGTALRDMVRREYARHPRVLRLEIGLNPGATDLVLREF